MVAVGCFLTERGLRMERVSRRLFAFELAQESEAEVLDHTAEVEMLSSSTSHLIFFHRSLSSPLLSSLLAPVSD